MTLYYFNEVKVSNLYKKKLRIKERFNMIFKVYYQESSKQVAVRENTKTLYLEAESELDVRKKLAHKAFNIEYVQAVTGAFLDYEQKNEDYKVLEIE